MSAYLLDTHVVVWLATESRRVPTHVRALLVDADRIHVSAASAYEVAQKVRLGRMPGGAALLARWDELLDAMIASELPLSAADMKEAGSMHWEHRDPFDRMLVAQSNLRGLELVTADRALRSYGEVRTTPWE